MAAGSADLNIYRGDDYIAQVTVLDASGAAANLVGYTAEAQVRTGLGDANAALAAQFTCSIAGNVITIQLPHTQTKGLARTQYYWDIQIIDTNGFITTLLAGSVTVTMEVTKLYA